MPPPANAPPWRPAPSAVGAMCLRLRGCSAAVPAPTLHRGCRDVEVSRSRSEHSRCSADGAAAPRKHEADRDVTRSASAAAAARTPARGSEGPASPRHAQRARRDAMQHRRARCSGAAEVQAAFPARAALVRLLPPLAGEWPLPDPSHRRCALETHRVRWQAGCTCAAVCVEQLQRDPLTAPLPDAGGVAQGRVCLHRGQRRCRGSQISCAGTRHR